MSRHRVVHCLLFAALVAFSSTSAMAQRGYGPSPYSERPFKWSGIYVGLQGGYGFSRVGAESGPFGGPFDQSYGYWSNGLFGGAHLGYNWQFGHYVFGLETDIDVGNTTASGTGSLGYTHETHIDWQSTFRARLGWATGQWLVYTTGGLALSHATINKTLPGGLAPFASATDRFLGWTVGAGVERAINQDTMVRLEYRYADFGSAEFSNAIVNTTDRTSITTHSIRGGVTFKF